MNPLSDTFDDFVDDLLPSNIDLLKGELDFLLIQHLFNTACRANISFENHGNLNFKVTESHSAFIIANHAEGGTGYVGFNITDPVAPLHMNGATRFSGSFTCQDLQGFSDMRLKFNIENIDTPLAEKLHDLEAVKYNWKKNPDGSIHFGFIAQDVEKEFPNLVSTDMEGLKSVNYLEMIPLLLHKINDLERKLEEIKNNN